MSLTTNLKVPNPYAIMTLASQPNPAAPDCLDRGTKQGKLLPSLPGTPLNPCICTAEMHKEVLSVGLTLESIRTIGGVALRGKAKRVKQVKRSECCKDKEGVAGRTLPHQPMIAILICLAVMISRCLRYPWSYALLYWWSMSIIHLALAVWHHSTSGNRGMRNDLMQYTSLPHTIIVSYTPIV
jgi:hypothetical protein